MITGLVAFLNVLRGEARRVDEGSPGVCGVGGCLGCYHNGRTKRGRTTSAKQRPRFFTAITVAALLPRSFCARRC